MRRSLLIAVLLSAAWADNAGQQSTPRQLQKSGKPKEAEYAGRNLAAEIDQLSGRVRNLEAGESDLSVRIAQLERREELRSRQLKQIKVDLANSGCESDFNRAHAMALAAGQPGYTLEGAAAMNCTERVRKMVTEIAQTLEIP